VSAAFTAFIFVLVPLLRKFITAPQSSLGGFKRAPSAE
jgi:hypothetical protein